MRTLRETEIIERFRDMAEADTVQAERFLGELGEVLAHAQNRIKPGQHCTSTECPYDFSHTAGWCGYSQPRRCTCPYDYPPKEGRP